MKQFIQLSIAIFFAFLVSTTSHAMTDYVKLLKTKSCPVRMSCVIQDHNFSSIPNPKATLIADLVSEPERLTCEETEGSYPKAPDKAAKECTAALQQTGLTDRERSEILVTLAYATQQLDNATMASSQKIEDRNVAKIFRKAIAADPNNIEAYHGLANFYVMFGDKDGALYVFADVLKERPLDANLMAHIANIYSLLNLKREALDRAQQAFQLNPNEPFAVYALASANYDLGNVDLAEKLLLLAQENFSKIYQSKYSYRKYLSPAFMLVDIYQKTNQPAKGLAVIAKYFPKNPSSADAAEWLAARGTFQEALGQLKEAAIDFEAAAKATYPEMAQKYMLRHDQILLRTNAGSIVAGNIQAQLALGKLQPILRTQIFLRAQGYKTVEITGHYDGPTQEALASCLEDNLCKQRAGKRASEVVHP